MSELMNIHATWFAKIPNFGDALNPILIEKISQKKVIWTATHVDSTHVKYMVIGSILQWADDRTMVWGSGFMCNSNKLNTKPKKICAVRGPLTREKLLSQDIECPEVYGDPALLYPRFYPSNTSKKYKLGLVPHYVDKDHPWLKEISHKNSDVLIIDIQNNVNRVVDDINSCETIASSSLHGIIIADAYDIPSTWIELSDKVVGKGFKFRDYFLSVNRRDISPLRINEGISLNKIYDQFSEYKIRIDLDLLYNSCPFKTPDLETKEHYEYFKAEDKKLRSLSRLQEIQRDLNRSQSRLKQIMMDLER
jgi:pyruvyltransferase